MEGWEMDALAAERRGRALVCQLGVAKGDAWLFGVSPGPEGEAMLAAARLARRFGAEVRVRLSPAGSGSPVWRMLADSTHRQGMLDENGWRDGGSRLIVRSGSESAGIAAAEIPDDDTVWRTSLANAWPFVRPMADNTNVAVTTAASRAMDKTAIGVFGVPGVCLMENAAVDAVIVATDMLEEAGGGSVLILVGGGNNGGDGLAVARGLARCGIHAEVALLKPEQSLTGDAAVNFELLQAVGTVPIHRLADNAQPLARLLASCSLAVDALLGTGFRGALSPAFADAVDMINASGKPILSLDLPSGLNGDGEETEGGVVLARRTIAFAAVKVGMMTERGRRAAGNMYIGDIGAPAEALGLE